MRARNGKKILPALLAAAMLLSAAGCGKKDGEGGSDDAPPELIEEYPFGEETVPGLTSEDSTARVSASTVVTYSYTGLSSPGKEVKAYVSLMTNEENGFAVVDRDFVKCDEPGYGDEGSVLLARNAPSEEAQQADEPESEEAEPEDGDAESEGGENEPESGGTESEGGEAEPESGDAESEDADTAPEPEPEPPKNILLLLDISWSADGCVVVTREAEGEIAEPPEPLTIREAQEYLESLSPEALGLEGESMDEYEVFTFDGAVIVDGRACVRMNVYNMNNVQQSNEFMGCFLMSQDGRHLYRMDTSTQEITEIEGIMR